MQGHKFIKAMFANNEKTTVESYWQNENDEVRVEYCPAVDGDEVYEMVKKHIDIETLHDETYEHIKSQDRIYREAVLSIAKEEGLVWDIRDLETDNKIEDLLKISIKAIFQDMNEKEEKERLFLYKLQLFELDKVKKSKNTKLKKELRQSKTMIEATMIVCKFFV